MDGGNPPLSSNITVIFTLEDINDNSPMFLNQTTEISVRENASIGSVVYRFQAIDVDLETQPLTYDLMSSTLVPFLINHETGELKLTSKLDAESATSQYEFTVSAADSDSQRSTLPVTITVTDVNEFAELTSTNASSSTELVEEEVAGFLFTVRVTDSDTDAINRMNEIHFTSGGEYFNLIGIPIVSSKTQIFRIGQYMPIDRENTTNGIITLTIVMDQLGNPPLEARFDHNFTILDKYDNKPYLTTGLFNFTETRNDITDTFVTIVELKDFVRDDDNGENAIVASYSLISVTSSTRDDLTQAFRRSNALEDEQDSKIHDGTLLGPAPLDREQVGGTLTVTMNFTDDGSPPLSRVDSFTIRIVDINDNLPIFVETEYAFELYENRERHSRIGSVMATDADDPNTINGMVIYSLDGTQSDFESFTVDQNNGTIRSNKIFDREDKAQSTIFISARDAASSSQAESATVKVTINIMDENDEPPTFTSDVYNFNINSGANVGDFVDKVVATDRDVDPQIVYNSSLQHLISQLTIPVDTLFSRESCPFKIHHTT